MLIAPAVPPYSALSATTIGGRAATSQREDPSLADGTSGSGVLGPASTRSGSTGASPLSNYGLPRDVIIARLSAADGEAASGSPANKAPANPDAIPARIVPGSDPAWGLSIASRYIGSYASSGQAAAAAIDLIV